MSYQAFNTVMKLNLPTTEKMVMVALANRANERNVCWPSLDRIADESGMAKRTAQRTIDKLVERTLVSKLSKGNGRGNSTAYRLNLDLEQLPTELILGSETWSECHPLEEETVSEMPPLSEERASQSPPLEQERVSESLPLEPVKVVTESERWSESPKKVVTVTTEPVREPVKEPIELFSDASQILTEPLQWVDYFVTKQGFQLHAARTAKTIPMFAQWCQDNITVGDMDQVIEIVRAQKPVLPFSPAYFDGPLKTYIANQQQAQSAHQQLNTMGGRNHGTDTTGYRHAADRGQKLSAADSNAIATEQYLADLQRECEAQGGYGEVMAAHD